MTATPEQTIRRIGFLQRRLWTVLSLLLPSLVTPATTASENAVTRMSVDPAAANTVVFSPVFAKFVRFSITRSSGSQPCVDELELYGPDKQKNLALASNGAKATASTCLPGYAAKHRIEHLNDGQYGNGHSWIAADPTGWAQIELPQPADIDRVVFSRDREGKYTDRVPTEFEIQISIDGREWQVVQSVVSTNLVAVETMPLFPNRVITLDFPAQDARFVQIVINKTNNGAPCIDELEVFGAEEKTNLALMCGGAAATASSCLPGHDIHKIEHLNDGQYTNAHSWIADSATGWAQIELPETVLVRRVVFSRDRGGRYQDRLPTDFHVRLSNDGVHWTTVKKITALANIRIDKRFASETPQEWAQRVAAGLPPASQERADRLLDQVESAGDVDALLGLHRLHRQRQTMAKRLVLEFDPQAIRRAVVDLKTTYADQYQLPDDCESTLAAYEQQLPDVLQRLTEGDVDQIDGAMTECGRMLAFQRSLLLANPLLVFDEILVLKRKTPETDQAHTYWKWGQKYGMTVNWSCDFRPKNPPVATWWEEEIAAVSVKTLDRPLRTVFQAPQQHMIQHPELHFDADRLLFAMPGPAGAFQVFEINLDGTGLHQVTADTGPDIDNGDPCYLPDGRIIFNSTRLFTGVPCEDGQSYVSNLCIADGDGKNTRLLTFDQESNWYPTLLNDGRVLYTRYEYANVSHQFGRLLFHMNPDGTGQMEYYGSNSYWPNSIFYARPIPNHPTMVAGVVCGHHGPNRTGRLVLFDPARGRHETSGAVQTIPGYGKPVERIVEDALYGNDWPKFVHPWPLSDKYFLVSARLFPDQTEYAVYLVDVFDNMTEICRMPDHSLLEPIPLQRRRRPPSVPDRIQPDARQATVFLSNVYEGPGLRGVPRGTAKKLRVFSYNYLYRHTLKRGFGHLATPGVDGPWEPRYILGTVPVKADGSALFTVPANTPISLQPLDDRGRAVQLMRSWFTAMPGEVLSCTGCHERQNSSPPPDPALAAMASPDPIEPWRGPPRGFDFELEVQPVLDRFCVGCHDGTHAERPDLARKSEEEKLRINQEYHQTTESSITTLFTPSFIDLHPYLRRPHAESNYGPQVAAEYFADTSPLIQMLEKGHHNVQLDEEGWDRLYTWIDLGVPDQGSWKLSEWGVAEDYYERRLEMLERYANRTDDVEWLPPAPEAFAAFLPPRPESTETEPVQCPGWPFDSEEAARRQQAIGLPTTLTVEVTDELPLEFVLIPAGEFVMGDPNGAPDERPSVRLRIDTPFYMSRCEITNAQFAALSDPDHFSGHVGWRSIDWRGEGYPLFGPDQPAVRVSWLEAMEFCRALSARAGKPIALPTEAQWEWACRAGRETPFWYGGHDDDFSPFENLAGREQQKFAFHGKRKWYLRDDRFDDGSMIASAVGTYRPNPWGLHDMVGNVSEWTRTAYGPYPYALDDGRDEPTAGGERVVRGGSWYVRPKQAAAGRRWKYAPWRKVFNVGFRVIMPVKR